MRISVAYAEASSTYWQTLQMPEGATVRDAIERSGVLSRYPDIDLQKQKVGIFGKVTPMDAALNDGDRVEIYRGITADPKTVPRRGGAADED